MLFLVATPIGNLQDISLRAIETLKGCDTILCEDTRHSKILLQAHGIEAPLKSFHQFNEREREDHIIADLKSGKTIAVVSDAGTPGICDPGESLVRRCWQEGIAVRGIPGPSAWLLALALSPFSKEKFQFVSFLPKKEGERKSALTDMLLYGGTSICYEAPHRIEETLELVHKMDPERKLCLMRELTKMYEQHLYGTASEILKDLDARGEIVLLMEGCKTDFSALTPIEHVRLLQETFGLEKNEAIKIAAELRHAPKREIYRAVLDK